MKSLYDMVEEVVTGVFNHCDKAFTEQGISTKAWVAAFVDIAKARTTLTQETMEWRAKQDKKPLRGL